MSKAILISVGGTLALLVYTLNQEKPSFIIFFASQETKRQIEQIRGSLKSSPEGTDQIITPSAEVLGDCYKALIEQLPQKLQIWGVTPSELLVDYTGGTKTMSAAIVLATVEMGCTYSYVGGVERNKGGIGVVLDGQERMHYVNNPWDQIALQERKRANILFNRARYAAARDVVACICDRVTQDQRPYYDVWLSIIKGYDAWDRFRHHESKQLLERGLRRLKPVAARDDSLKQKSVEIEANVNFLRELIDQHNDELFVYDLIANATRRANLEDKHDDAVARLYRAIEKAAQVRLKTGYQINTSKVEPEQIPDSIREEYKRRYAERDGKLQLGLVASYRLLKELGDELGQSFSQRYDTEIKPLLDSRNMSILAHGDQPVTGDLYRELLGTVTGFIPIDQTKLPKFPELDL